MSHANATALKTYETRREVEEKYYTEDLSGDSYDFESETTGSDTTYGPAGENRNDSQLRQISRGNSPTSSHEDYLNELDQLDLESPNSADQLTQTLSDLEAQVQKKEMGEFVFDDATRKRFLEKINELKRQLEAQLLPVEEASMQVEDLKSEIESTGAEAAAEREGWVDTILSDASSAKQKVSDLKGKGDITEEQANAFAAKADAIAEKVKSKSATLTQAQEELKTLVNEFNTQLTAEFEKKKGERAESIQKVSEAMDKIINEYPQDGYDIRNLDGANNGVEAAGIVLANIFAFGGLAWGAAMLDGDGKSFPPERAAAVQVATAIKTALLSEESGSDTTNAPGQNGNPATPRDKWSPAEDAFAGLGENSYKYAQVVVSAIYEIAGKDEAETLRLLNVFPPSFRSNLITVAQSNQKFVGDRSFLGDQYHLQFTAGESAELLAKSKNEKDYDYYYKDSPEQAPEISSKSPEEEV